ncbi:MAG: hypothetical protein HQK76_19385 [Desulfobacterales bacterium]|nr:hypothetical protein [Desulfobacterales bacterium]
MSVDDKVISTVLLVIIAVELIFIKRTGSTNYHITIKDKPLDENAKRFIWGFIVIVLIVIWFFV